MDFSVCGANKNTKTCRKKKTHFWIKVYPIKRISLTLYNDLKKYIVPTEEEKNSAQTCGKFLLSEEQKSISDILYLMSDDRCHCCN